MTTLSIVIICAVCFVLGCIVGAYVVYRITKSIINEDDDIS
jgi:uncharacterized protein YneF (UPF0154 family)